MKSVKKALTYRLLAFTVGGGTTALFLALIPNLLVGGATGIVVGELTRTGLYVVHEKWYEGKLADVLKPKLDCVGNNCYLESIKQQIEGREEVNLNAEIRRAKASWRRQQELR